MRSRRWCAVTIGVVAGLLLGASPALAGPLAPLIPIIVTALVTTAVSTAASFAISAIAGGPVLPATKSRGVTAGGPSENFVRESRGRTEQIREAITPRRTIYGEVLVSGPIIYAEAYDEDTLSGNEMLSLVIVLAGHEVDSFQAFYLDDNLVVVDSGGAVTTAPYNGFAWILTHTGTANQAADANLVASSKGKWTAAHRLRGVAYVHMKLKFNEDVFPTGVPKLRVLVRGRQVFDTRDSSTGWRDNAALALRDYLVSDLKVDPADIDDTTVTTAANVCAEAVPLVGGGNEARYNANGTVDSDSRPADVIERLLSAMAGQLTYSGGKWQMFAGAARTATITLDEDDLIGGITVEPRISRREIFNSVKPIFVDPAQSWQAVSAPELTNATYEAQDGGQRIVKTLELPFTTSSSMAQRLGKIELERARQQISVNFPAKLGALRLKVWDVVKVTNTRFGWTDKEFRIVAMSIGVNLEVNLSLREEAAAVWAWSLEETVIDPAPDTDLPDGLSLAAPAAVNLSEELRTTGSGTVMTVLIADVAPIEDAFLARYDAQFKKTADADWTDGGNSATTRFEFPGLEDGTSYDVRARGINSIGVRSSWTTATHVLVGQTAPPADVANFAVNIIGGEAHLSWDAVPDLDLSHYRVRWASDTAGATWGNAIDLIQRVGKPATSVTVQTIVGSYLIKAVDLKGNLSVNAAIIATTVGSVAGLNVVQTETEHSGFAGAKTNVAVVGGNLRLDTAHLFDSVAGNFDDATGLFDEGGSTGSLAASGTYSFTNTVDLGAVYTSRLTAALTVSANDLGTLFDDAQGNFDDRSGLFDGEVPDSVDVTIEVRTTEDDPGGAPTWSGWKTLAVGDYKARAFQVRALLTTQDTNMTPLVSALSATVDMPDRVIAGDDIVADAGGEVIVFTPAFRVLAGVGISAQGLATGDYYSLTAKSATGFTIRFFDPGDIGVARTFDYIAKGHGEIAA